MLKMKVLGGVAALAAAVCIPLLASKAMAQEKDEAPAGHQSMSKPMGKITPWKAIEIATGKVPGKALNANFEFDEGHWVYGVIVVSGKTLQEVEIDPMTGKIGDVEKIDPVGEGKELTGELQKAIGATGMAKEAGEKGEKGEAGEAGEKPEKSTGGGGSR